jgi:eukaryotic-like serine/threonine-protein kinase
VNERTERLKDLFADASGLEAPERENFLASLGKEDPDAAAEIRSLLNAHTHAGDFLSPLFPVRSENTPDPRIGLSVGPYRVSRLIARGGMGEIYEAIRDDGAFDRKVAIKLMRYGASPEELQRRFAIERQTLARLEHPNIARLLDGGTLPDGIPYLVMEYVEGKRFDEYADEFHLTLEQRLAIFLQVCSAVQYAHQHLVIHRDLKPGNILVTPDGNAKLLDFGIAKLMHGNEPGIDDQTGTGQNPFTPEYASPEQLRGLDVTTSTDVYSLGVLLYKLCTGQKPYEFKSRLPHDIAATIIESEPSKPGAREILIEASEGKERLHQKLAGDLGSVIMMALRKEPERRYLSVDQFARDIERYLDGMPVIARLNTFPYRAVKFIRRNKAAVSAALLVFFILCGSLAATLYQIQVVKSEKAKTETINSFLKQFLNYANPIEHTAADSSHRTTMDEMLDDAARRIEREGASIQPEIRAELERTLAESYGGRSRYDLMYQHIRNFVAIEEQLYGKNDPKLLEARGLWAAYLFAHGRMTESEEEFKTLLPRMRQALADGTIKPYVLYRALNDYGYLRRTQGNSHDAELAFREVLTLAPALSSEERAHIGIPRSTLASTLADQGKFAEALATSRQAVEDFRRMRNTTSPDYGFALTVFGGFLTENGSYDTASAVLRDAEILLRKTLSATSLWLGDNLRNQAALYYQERNFPAALSAIDEALKIYTESFGPHYDHYPTALMARGLALNGMGKPAEAESVLRTALKLRTESLPAGHFFTALAQSALAECLTTQGKFTEAETLLLASYADLMKSQGESNPRTLQTRHRLATLYDRWNKPELANRYRS